MSIGQQFRVGYHISNPLLGWDLDLPAFTCAHCQRVTAPGTSRAMEEGWDASKLNSVIADWRAKVSVCRKCDAFVCRLCTKIDGECTTIKADVDRSFEDLYKQPWMLRDGGEPVRRIFDKDGNVILARESEIGYTDRELSSIGDQLNYDGSSKWDVGERPVE